MKEVYELVKRLRDEKELDVSEMNDTFKEAVKHFLNLEVVEENGMLKVVE